MSVLDVTGLTKVYPGPRNAVGRVTSRIEAVKDVSFSIEPGRTLGLVGESGAGKSTVGRLVLRLVAPTSGSIVLLGEEISAMKRRKVRLLRRRAQMIFQDPFSSLDPRMVVADSVGEPLTVFEGLRGRERDRQVLELFDQVGLGRHHFDRYPHEFSGGQLQRVAIARALATNPEFIVCDEPVAALDVSIQAQVLNLLLELQRERGLSYLFISHDLAVVRMFAHDIAVMYAGEIVERGTGDEIFDHSEHSYTRTLIDAIPKGKPRAPRAGASTEAAPVPVLEARP